MKKVLIVDDTKNIRNLLTTCLEMEDYEVITAKDGTEALSIIKKERFDLIFLDIKLPKISGTEVLRRMRESDINTPVIIMTAFASVKNAVECTKLGAVSYLQKPFTADKVRHVLHEINYGQKPEIQKETDHLDSAGKLIARNELDEAFTHLTRAFSRDPGCEELYYLLSEIYRHRGDTEKAALFKAITDLIRKTKSIK